MKIQEILQKLTRNVSRLLSGFRADLITLRGTEKYSRQPLTTLYIGYSKQFNFITDFLYSDYEILDNQTNVHSIKWLRSIKRSLHNPDLVVCEFPSFLCPFFKRKQYLVIPDWINHKINLEKPWDDVMLGFRKHMRREALKKIRQHNLSICFSTKDSDFEIFYEDMLLPCMENRFGNQAMALDKDITKKKFKEGELMKLFMGTDIIGMGLIIHDKEKNQFYFNKLGSPYIHDNTIYRAVNIGLYYFTIKEAHDRGCSHISLGHTRPLLNDGLFQYKRKWGAEIDKPRFFQSNILLNPINFNDALRSLFTNNIFLISEKKNYSTKLLIPRESANADSMASVFERYDTNGLNHFKIFSCEGFDGNPAELEDDLPGKIKLFDLSASTNPAKDFCRL